MSMKNKLGIGTLILPILLACIMFMPAASAQEESLSGIGTLDVVSVEQAEKVASYTVKEISGSLSDLSEWKNASVKLDITYYDLDGNKAAYAFNIINNNEYDGFIIISATKNKYPILEFSKGKLPNKISNQIKRSQSTATDFANKNQLKVGESIPIYEGATFYGTEYDLKDSRNMIKKKIIVDDVTLNMTIREAETAPTTTKQKTVENNEVKEAWSNLENKMVGTTSITAASSSYKISNFPYELWYRGCAPTSASMVLEYWKGRGYPNLPTGQSLINELANAMHTNQTGATLKENVDDGIETVCYNHGYSHIDAVNDNTDTMTKYMSELNMNRPFILNMENGGRGSGYTNPYGDHAVACYGYYRADPTKYLYIHDTWQTVEHYISYGNWRSAMATWVRP